MKRPTRLLTALLAAALLAGCGSISSKDGGYYTASANDSSYEMAVADSYDVADAEESAVLPASGSAMTAQDAATEIEQKIVYTADLSMESTDFNTARDTLLAAVEQSGGYMQYTSLSGNEKDHNRYANYTARIPAENYRSFLSAAGNAGSVLSMSENAENITSSYIDVEARLTALQNQRDRLNALAEQAETTSDLLEIESQLSDVQYQLENYTQQLRNMDSQVSYSTVEIRLSEVATLTPTGTSFAERVADAFLGGWSGFVAFVQELILAVIYLWPLLLIAGVVVVLLVALAKRRAKHPKPPKPARAAVPVPPSAYSAPAPAAPPTDADKKE